MGNPVTYGWLLYRGDLANEEIMGLYQTEEAANADRDIITKPGEMWKVKSVMFIGWGYVAPGVFGQNGKPPLKVV